MAYQITGVTIVYSAVFPGADQRKHQRSASLAFVREISGVRLIVMFHNYFSLAVSIRRTYISLYVEQPPAVCIAIFNKYCCYIKYGTIKTNLTL